MSKRIINLICGFSALGIGGILYVLFREETIIARLVRDLPFIELVRSVVSVYSCSYLMYYVPDFLWAFSLGSLLIAIPGNGEKAIYCGIFAFICGFLWEILQYYRIVNGTFDWVDIIMYLLAGLLCILINYKERET